MVFCPLTMPMSVWTSCLVLSMSWRLSATMEPVLQIQSQMFLLLGVYILLVALCLTCRRGIC